MNRTFLRNATIVFVFWVACVAAILAVLAAPGCAFAQSITAPAADSLLSNPLSLLTAFYEACKHGQGWLAGTLLLFITVGALRIYGAKAHAAIPDDTQHPLLKPLEKVLAFFFDTKKGAWVLNWLTALAACLGVPYLAGMAIDAESWRLAFEVSVGGTALSTLKKDIAEARAVPDPAITAPGADASIEKALIDATERKP